MKDYAEIARPGGATKARVTQVMNLLNLAPTLQGKLLSGAIDGPCYELSTGRFISWISTLVELGDAAVRSTYFD